MNAENILQGLKNNQSLKSLEIGCNVLYGDLMLSRFFQTLPLCPNLEKLDLWDHEITKSDLEQVIQTERLQKPIVLNLDSVVVYENATVTTELLRCHPEVRMIFDDPDEPFGNSIELEHIFELNWHGRYLLDSPLRVPLSLWSLVFENVNKSSDYSDNASAIYEFLKGPAFAARNKGSI